MKYSNIWIQCSSTSEQSSTWSNEYLSVLQAHTYTIEVILVIQVQIWKYYMYSKYQVIFVLQVLKSLFRVFFYN